MPFRFGKYENEVLCDVVPMQTGHLLLGQPGHLDRRANYHGATNEYSFLFNRKTIVVLPSTPKQVREDQETLQKRAKEWEKEK